MGEAAEMMLDGTLCGGCGVYMEGTAPGHPRYCSKECAEGRGVFECDGPQLISQKHPRRSVGISSFGCDKCNRKFRSLLALAQHIRDKHEGKGGATVSAHGRS